MMVAEVSLSHSCSAHEPGGGATALFNHTWQICAMESEVFNKRCGPFIKGLFKTKKGEKKIGVQ